jgi:hypothetical protein
MFKKGDIIKVKREKSAIYSKQTVGQSYVLSDITDSNVIVGAKTGNLIGMNDSNLKFADMSLMDTIFELDVPLTRRFKLEKICSKLETK